jgi:two-component system invasion response regulator UvrY
MKEKTAKTINIAIADDHVLFRKGLAELIAGFEHMAVLFDVSNGKEMVDELRKAKNLPDICILDINMPILNGYETAPLIRKEWPEMKMLALSMYDTEFNIIKMIRAGADGYVLKDAEPRELQKALMAIDQEGFYHSELVSGRALRGHSDKTVKLHFTDKEEQFLSYCSSDMTYKDIAEIMNVSPRTVDGYRDTLFAKLDIKTRTGLAIYAIKSGLAKIA